MATPADAIPPRSTRYPGPPPTERDPELDGLLRKLMRRAQRAAPSVDPDTGQERSDNPVRWRLGLPRDF
jgi:hypothetical protein